MKRRAILLACALLAFGCGDDERLGGSAATGGAANGGSAGTVPGGGGTTASGGTAAGGGSGGASLDGGDCSSQAQGIAVADVDLDGFPAYAIDGCQLLYVSAESSALVLRNLETGAEQVVAPGGESPRRPTFGGGVMAWEADLGGKSVVRVRALAEVVTLTGMFDHAGEPRACADAVVFTGWLGPSNDSDSDVFLYSVSDKSVAPVASGAGQQRFADVSSTHVAVSDFSEDPGGVYAGDGTTLADVVLVDRSTGSSTKRALPGKQAFPMLGSSGMVSYLEWVSVHPVPKLQEYSIQAVPLSTPSAPGMAIGSVQSEQAVRPTAKAGVVEWVSRWSSESKLWRAPLDATAPPAQVMLGSLAVLHAPAASSTMTVLAVRTSAGAAPELLAIPR